MKEMFPEYYRPSEEQFAELWDTATFVFDANVLLDIYRYSPQTSDELIEILRSLQDRVWLPYQFALEYHKHLYEVSSIPPSNYNDAIKRFDKIKNQIEDELKNLKARTRINIENWTESFQNTFYNIQDEIAKEHSEHQQYLLSDIPAHLDQIFSGKIGREYTKDELNKIYNEGKNRYKIKTPPGYADGSKEEPSAYNDLVGWKQIIEFAKQAQKSIIFITRDTKEDWFKNVVPTT